MAADGAGRILPWLLPQLGGAALGIAVTIDGAGWLAWPGMWLLVARLDQRSGWERAGDGSLAGVWAATVVVGPWLIEALRVHAGLGAATALTGGVIAVYGGLTVAAFAWLWPHLPAPRAVSGAAAWALLEVARSYASTGVGWALLGHSQQASSALAQVAEVGGVPLVSFVVAVPGLAVADRRARRTGLVIAITILLGAAAFGGARRAAWSRPAPGDMRVRGVSGGHLSSDSAVAYLAATADGPAADLVVWPAHAVPGVLQDDPGTLASIAAGVRRWGPLLFGAEVREQRVADGRRFDAAILLGAGASMRGRYDKRRLVPFVERPLAGLGGWAGISPGAGAAPLAVASLRVAPLLGWESACPDLARSWARAGADLLVAMADDEGPPAAVRQLERFSRHRAVETRRPMLRVSGTGRTVVIDPAGRRVPGDVLEIAPAGTPSTTLHVRAPWTCPAALAGLLALLVAGGVVLGRPR